VERESPEPVADAAHRLIAVVAAAEAVIATPDAIGTGMIGGSVITTQQGIARLPGNQGAFFMITRTWAEVRKLEAWVSERVTGESRERGGSDRNTHEAIMRLADAAPALGGEEESYVARRLDGCADEGMALRAVAEPAAWVPIVLDGIPTPLCPYCQTPNLRKDPWGLVVCFKFSCPAITDGSRPAARVNRDRRGRVHWVWPDGTRQP
jgi:hypothetical protein